MLTPLSEGALWTPRNVTFANGRSRPVKFPDTATLMLSVPLLADELVRLTSLVELGARDSPSSRYNEPTAEPSIPGATMIDQDVFLAARVVMAICCVARILPPRMKTGICPKGAEMVVFFVVGTAMGDLLYQS
jgi:hypothetical protein